MPTVQVKAKISAQELIDAASQLDSPELEVVAERVSMLRAERRAPHLSKQETELFEIINYHRSPEAQARFELLIKRRQASKITSEELAELITMTDQSEIQAAERVRAASELAEIRGLSFQEMWQQLGL